MNKKQMDEIIKEFFDKHVSTRSEFKFVPQKKASQRLEICDDKIKRYIQILNEEGQDIDVILKGHLLEGNIYVTSDEFSHLREGLLKALIEATRIEKERLSGNYDNWYDDFRSILKPTGLTQVQPELIPEKAEGKMLSEIIYKFCQEKITKKEWNNKNRDENIAFYEQFLLIIGDRNIREYSRDDFLRVIDIFKKFPKHVNKVKGLRDKPLNEILTLIQRDELKDYKALDVTTVNKNITRFNAVFRYSLQHGYITVNYADGLKVKGKKSPKEQRKIYEPYELTKWFTSPLYCEYPDEKILERPERFWVPLIMMLNGCRPNEVCQLYKEDIYEVDGIWCIDINREKDKSVKTDEGVRIVPIHPFLIELGFLSYVKSVQHERIWSNLRKSNNDWEGYAYLFNKWSERYNRKYISTDKKKVPYSLRHNFITNLKEQDVSESLVAEITGHVVEGMTYGRYGKAYSVKTKLEGVTKVNYNIDLSHLKFPLKKKS